MGGVQLSPARRAATLARRTHESDRLPHPRPLRPDRQPAGPGHHDLRQPELGIGRRSLRGHLWRLRGRGGNFLDTADTYSLGRSEELLGGYVAQRGLRDQLVLATKFTWNAVPGVPVTGGNGRKNIYRALDASLRRLQTDYVDLYWLHHWDLVTPVEEVLGTLGDLVRTGRIRYFGFSNVPAWYAAQAATLAQVHGVENKCCTVETMGDWSCGQASSWVLFPWLSSIAESTSALHQYAHGGLKRLNVFFVQHAPLAQDARRINRAGVHDQGRAVAW